MDACIKCKLMDCVEVCPVDCFYEGENFLAINPDECIDCGVCEPECPVDAIKPDTEDDADGKWLKINSEYSRVWPNITVKGQAPDDAEAFERETGKLEKYFSEKPGRPVKVGDTLVFALGGRLTAVRVEAIGERRGPPVEARALYSPLEISS